MRVRAIHARLLAATALSLALTAPSRAATNGLESGDSNAVSNPAGTTITGDRKGVYSYGPALNLDNAGTIRGNGFAGSVNDSDGGIIFSGGPGTITNSGSISGARFGISTIYFNNGGTFEGRAIGSTVTNSGSIIGDSDDGIRLIGGGSVTNSGYIAGRVGAGADGISMFAYNGQNTTGMTSLGSVTNLAGGVIEGNRFGVIIFGPGSIDNAGTINHQASIQGSPLFGPGQVGTITNSGTINAGGISMAALDTANVINSGSVTSPVGFAGVTNANLNNSGTIDYFASFNTVGSASVNNSGSIGEGLIFKKTTNAGVTNSGSIIATNTPDVVGTTRDAVYSDAALSLTNTSTGSINGFANGIRSDGSSAAIDNAGTIRGNGTTGGTTATNAGIIISGGPASITNSGSISGARYGISTIWFTNPDSTIVGKAIGSTASNSGSIIGDNDDGIRFIGGGAVTNSGYIAGREGGDLFGTANPPHSDGVSMFSYDDQDPATFGASVTNSAGGQILGNRFGVILSNGGTVDNSGLILGYRGGGVLIQALIPGMTGSVANAEGAQIWGGVKFQGLSSASVDNSGAIDGVNATEFLPGVWSYDPLTLNNSATGVIEGSSDGVRSDGASLNLNNAGTIFGLGTTDNIENGANGGVILSGGPASITNSGSISGAKFGIATVYFTNPDNSITGLTTDTTVNNSGSIVGEGNDGIRLHGGGTVTNSGYIAGRVRVGADGVSILAFDGQDLSGLSSAGIGTVNNLAGGVIEGHRMGIIISDGGTVNNAGTINGGYRGAIVLEARDAGRIGTLTNSGTINGIVEFIQLDSASLANSGAILAPAGAAVHGYAFDGYMGPLAVTNDATGTIIGGTSGIFSEGASLSLNNAGSIRGNGTSVTARVADAGILVTGGPASITNSGSISGAGFGITTGTYSDFITNAASSRAIGSTVTNTGSIIGDTNDGIRLIGGGTVTNSGLISGRVGAVADGVSAFAFDGQDVSGSTTIATVNNLAGGTIDGHRFGIVLSGGGAISNAGTINGGTSGAILIQTKALEAGRTGSVANSGSIWGNMAFNDLASAAINNSGAIHGSTAFNNVGTIGVTNSGSITDFLSATGGNFSLTNSGSITAPGTAIFNNGPLTISNSALGSIVSLTDTAIYSSGAITLNNAGAIHGDALLGVASGGASDNITNSGTISGYWDAIVTWDAPTTLTNNGTLHGNHGYGAKLDQGGSVTNSGQVAGEPAGLYLGNSASVTNSAAGSITGAGLGIDARASLALSNAGSISGAGTVGVQLLGGSVSNLAGGSVNGNSIGIYFVNGAGSVTNAGTIGVATGDAAIAFNSMSATAPSTVVNSGTISGGSVQFGNNQSASLNNSGSITARGSGLAVWSITPTTLVNSGSISTAGSTAISLFAGASVSNSGSIVGGLNYNGAGGNLTNSGSISAASGDAVYGEGPLTVVNNAGGSIAAPNGFGIRSAGAATVNNSGAISSSFDALYLLGGGTVTNSGSIVSSNGAGIDLQGGAYSASVTNLAAGVIQGLGIGVIAQTGSASLTNAGTIRGDVALLVNNGSLSNSGTINGIALLGGGATATLTNSGTITASGSAAVYSVKSFTNSGTINGGTGTAVFMTSGNDTATLNTGSSISGAVDGGNGSDTLRLSGTIITPTALQTVGRFLNFETLNVLGGYWTAPGNTGTFTSTTINGGALAVNGTLTSPVIVNAGAMLAGIGTITGATTLNSGGLLAPGGSSLGTLSITGNVAFNAGSTLSIQTNPNGTSDKLAVTGAVTITRGSTLQVLAGIANYAPTTSYVVVNATGGINGKFDTVTTDYAYFKATVNTQQKGTITVQIAPNGKPLPSAATALTFSTATAVDALGGSSPLYQAVLYQSLTGARQAFDALSGSAYGRLDALMDRDVGNVRLGFDGSDSDAPTLSWTGVNSLAARGANSSLLSRRGALSLFMVGGRYGTRLSSDSISGDVDTRFLASAAAYKSGRFTALASVTSAWHDVSVARTIVFPGFAERSQARYRSTTQRLEVEGTYALSRGPIGIAPYAGYAHVMISSPAFAEAGGLSALSFGRESRAIDQLRLGLRAAARVQFAGLRLAPHVDAEVERVWGASDPAQTARFAGGGRSFDSGAWGFNSRAVSIDAGLDVVVGPATLTASYRERRGDQWSDRAGLVTAALRF